MIKTIRICTNCREEVPNKCDGVLYYIKEWGKETKLCIGGMKRDQTLRIKNGKLFYHFVRGFGEEWDVELFKLE